MKRIKFEYGSSVQPFIIASAHYASMMGVKLRIAGSVAYTNGKTITIPSLKFSDERAVKCAYGYLAHEGAHCRYTNFPYLMSHNIKGDLLKHTIMNILEDSRIEKIMGRNYIGVYENFKWLNSYLNEEAKTIYGYLDNLNKLGVYKLATGYMSSYTLNHNNKYDDEYDFEGKIRTELVNTFGVKFANELDKLLDNVPSARSTEDLMPTVEKIEKLLLSANIVSPKQEQEDNNFENNAVAQHEYDKIVSAAGRPTTKQQENIIKNLSIFAQEIERSPSNGGHHKSIADTLEGLYCEGCKATEVGRLSLVSTCKDGRADYLNVVSSGDLYGLRRTLNARLKAWVASHEHNSDTGKKLDIYRAQRITCGETEIFKRRTVREDHNTSVHILVDISSSMRYRLDGTNTTRAEEACKCALAIATALEGVEGIKVACTYFPGLEAETDVALEYGQRASQYAPRFDQKPRGSTPTAQALWRATYKDAQVDCGRKVMVIITDGMPNSVEQVNDWLKACGNDYTILPISIGCDTIKSLFSNAIVVDSAKELLKNSFNLLKDIFKPLKVQD